MCYSLGYTDYSWKYVALFPDTVLTIQYYKTCISDKGVDEESFNINVDHFIKFSFKNVGLGRTNTHCVIYIEPIKKHK